MKYSAKWLVLMSVVVSVGCDKAKPVAGTDKGAPADSAKASAVTPSPSAVNAVTAPAAHVDEPSAATPTGSFDVTTLSPIPTSFESGTKVNVENAVGVGCETKVVDDWLELLCYNKNGTGGRPVRARVPALGTPGETTVDVPSSDGGAPTAMHEFVPEASGMMHVVVPWNAGYSARGMIEWTDTRYVLRVDGQEAKLGWDVTVAMRKACATLEQDQRALVERATKQGGPDAPVPADVAKLPHFGRCQPAGSGSWAMTLAELTATGEGAKRNLKASFEMAWVDFDGKVVRGAAGALAFAPQKLAIPRLVSFDYDGDGRDEVIVDYELEGTSEPTQKPLAAVWTFDGAKITGYAKAPALALGGVSVEQLDKDMRPDLGSYGPYVAWLSGSCGVARCPERLTGPRLFAHSDKDGGFSLDDDAVHAAAQRACGAKPATIVPAAPVNLQKVAQNVACAKLWKTDAPTITGTLMANRDKLCGAAAECEALTVLTSWANTDPPFTLSQ